MSRKRRSLHFKSKNAYRKWLAYNYIHHRRQMRRPPHKIIYIRGKRHRVKHR